MTEPTTIDRLAPTYRPGKTVLGYQKWRSLLFVHWRTTAASLRPLIPAGLEIDTFDGSAWVGLIPFHMTGVRPRWVPPIPGFSTFHETNLRTYVHAGGVPGVWFFSLDAENSPAVRIARGMLGLPYFRADMSVQQDGRAFRYCGHRRWPPPSPADYDVRAEVGGLFTDGAAPETLEHFLIERYHLYTVRPDGRLSRAQVHHRSYPLREARVTELTETLRTAAGLPDDGPIAHTCFSDGVDVEIFPLESV